MILKLMLDITITIITFIMGIVANNLPNVDFIRYYKDVLEIIHTFLQTSVNFLYFVVGEAMFPLLSLGITMLFYRYLIFPVVVIVRRIIIKGGDE